LIQPNIVRHPDVRGRVKEQAHVAAHPRSMHGVQLEDSEVLPVWADGVRVEVAFTLRHG
jgi:hypothetical protein